MKRRRNGQQQRLRDLLVLRPQLLEVGHQLRPQEGRLDQLRRRHAEVEEGCGAELRLQQPVTAGNGQR